MALVVFESRVNMLTVATPSVGGYVIGYDSTDGILKQKNDQGVITPIAGSNSAGSLSQTLAKGASTGTYSIYLGANCKIGSGMGGGQLRLDNGVGGTNIVNLSTDSGALVQSYLFMNSNSITLKSVSASLLLNSTSASFQLNTSNIMSFNSTGCFINLGNRRVLFLTTGTSSTDSGNKAGVIISSSTSRLGNGVYNTVILGGDNIIGANANSVYVPNLYVKNGGFIKGTSGLGKLIFNSDNETYLLSDTNLVGILSANSAVMSTYNGIFISDNIDTITTTTITANTFISTSNTTVDPDLTNVVVIGGDTLSITQSNTTYIGGSVSIGNKYLLPGSDGSSGQVIQTDGNGNTFWGNFGGSVTEITAASFSALSGTFEPNVTYKVLDADSSLYGGTEIYLTTNSSGVLNETGVGKFYNPKYDKTVSGFFVWSSSNSYILGDSVFWGGLAWANNSGTNSDPSIDILTLSSSEWDLIPYDGPFSEFYYNIAYDEIKYDWQNDLIIHRNERNSNIVSTSVEDLYWWINNFGYSPIRVFQWGNTFNLDNATGNFLLTNKGIGTNRIIESYNENINFTGSYQIGINFTNRSYQTSINFINGSYQSNIDFYRCWQFDGTFDNSHQDNIRLKNYDWNRSGNVITTSESNLTFLENKHLFGNNFNINEALSNVNIKGTLNYTLATASGIFNASGEAVYYGTAAIGLTAGYLYANIGGTWSEADNINNYSYQLGIALGETPSIDGLLIKGFVHANHMMYLANVGSTQYISDVSAEFTEFLPTGSSYVRVIGHMVQDGILYFNPEMIGQIIQLTKTTSTDFNASDLINGLGQNGRHIIIDNGANDITVDIDVDTTTSYQMVGTGSVTFTAVGSTLQAPRGATISTQWSSSSVSYFGTTKILLVNNV